MGHRPRSLVNDLGSGTGPATYSSPDRTVLVAVHARVAKRASSSARLGEYDSAMPQHTMQFERANNMVAKQGWERWEFDEDENSAMFKPMQWDHIACCSGVQPFMISVHQQRNVIDKLEPQLCAEEKPPHGRLVLCLYRQVKTKSHYDEGHLRQDR